MEEERKRVEEERKEERAAAAKNLMEAAEGAVMLLGLLRTILGVWACGCSGVG